MSKAKAVKKEKGQRGGVRGAEKTKDGILLRRAWGGVEYEALAHEGVVTVKGKDYLSLVEAVAAIKGKPQRGSGRTFFGLRTAPNIGLGDEVMKMLKDAKEEVEKKAAAAKPAKAKKAKKAKEEEDDEDGFTSVKASMEPAKVSAKGRK